MRILVLGLIFIPILGRAECASDTPDYLVEIEVNFCKTVKIHEDTSYVENKEWSTTLLKGRIKKSAQLPLSASYHERYNIDDTEIKILMGETETKDCASFGHEILSDRPISLVLYKMCCDAGQAYCKQANYWGYDLPSDLRVQKGIEIDLDYDFIGKPAKETYEKERQILDDIIRKKSVKNPKPE